MKSPTRPITTEEYEQFLAELYKQDESGRTIPTYKVELDDDPSLNPRTLSEKLKWVQAHKNRVVVIFNRAISNESYWRKIVKRLNTKFKSTYNKAMMNPDVRKEKSSDLRESCAEITAGVELVNALFDGKGTYEDNMIAAEGKHIDAQSFLNEVKNIYENLDSTDMNLARQQKNVLICAKLYGEVLEDDRRSGIKIGE